MLLAVVFVRLSGHAYPPARLPAEGGPAYAERVMLMVSVAGEDADV
jgi:hypothetical protein